MPESPEVIKIRSVKVRSNGTSREVTVPKDVDSIKEGDADWCIIPGLPGLFLRMTIPSSEVQS